MRAVLYGLLEQMHLCKNSMHGICRQILKEGQLQRRQLVELQKDLKSSTEGMLSSSKSANEPAAGADQSDAGGSQFTRDMYSLDTTQSHMRATGIPL